MRAGYQFNEGAGTTAADHSGNNNTGTLTNGPLWARGKNLTLNAGGAVTTGKIIGDGADIAITGQSVTVSNTLGSAGNGTVNITSVGNVTLDSGSSVQAGDSGNSLVINSTGGSLINNAGANALQAPNGRWLVYSDNPTNTTEGGLTYSKQYNRTFANNAPGTIAAGNHILYSVAPFLSVSAQNASKTYGALNPGFTLNAITGFIDGDTEVSALTGEASASTVATQSSDVGTYDIDAALGTLASSLGYQFSFTPGTLIINKAPLTVTANNASKRLGETNPPFSVTYNGFVLGQTASILNGTLGFLTPGENTQGLSAITPYGLSHANYGISFIDGVFTVGARPIVNLGVPYLLNAQQSPNTVTPMQFSQQPQLFNPTVVPQQSPLAVQTTTTPTSLTLPPSPRTTQFFGGLFTIIHPRKKYGEP